MNLNTEILNYSKQTHQTFSVEVLIAIVFVGHNILLIIDGINLAYAWSLDLIFKDFIYNDMYVNGYHPFRVPRC